MAVTYLNKYEYMSELLQENNGYLFTTQVQKTGISRTYLAKFVQKNMSRLIQYGEQLNIYS